MVPSDFSRIHRGTTLVVIEIGRNRNDNVFDFLTIELGGQSHEIFDKHGTDLLRCKFTISPTILHIDHRLSILIRSHGKAPVLHILLDAGVIEVETNQTLHIIHRVLEIPLHLVLCNLSKQSSFTRKGYHRWRCPFSLFIRYNGYAFVTIDTNAGIGRSKINTCYSVSTLSHQLFFGNGSSAPVFSFSNQINSED